VIPINSPRPENIHPR